MPLFDQAMRWDGLTVLPWGHTGEDAAVECHPDAFLATLRCEAVGRKHSGRGERKRRDEGSNQGYPWFFGN